MRHQDAVLCATAGVRQSHPLTGVVRSGYCSAEDYLERHSSYNRCQPLGPARWFGCCTARADCAPSPVCLSVQAPGSAEDHSSAAAVCDAADRQYQLRQHSQPDRRQSWQHPSHGTGMQAGTAWAICTACRCTRHPVQTCAHPSAGPAGCGHSCREADPSHRATA